MKKNIYEMYHNNDNKFGFFVKRNSWEKTVAQITSIKGVTEGEAIKGKNPYYGNPAVQAKFFSLTVNAQGDVEQEVRFENFIEEKELSSPGNFSYQPCELPLA